MDKNAVFLGGGVGLNFELADAIFAPLVTRRLTEAEAARARVVTDNVQLDVALTYLDLLRAYGALAVNAETLANAETTLRFARAGVKSELAKPADANRAAAEVEFRRQERIDLQGQAAAVSAPPGPIAAAGADASICGRPTRRCCRSRWCRPPRRWTT